MRITLATVTERRRIRFFEDGLREYVARLGHFVPVEDLVFATETAFWAALDRQARGAGKRAGKTVLLDARGQTLSSEQLANWVGEQRDGGSAHLLFAIGPADGWSAESRKRADLLLSFGPMTFPHELARVMLAEQLYRAFTILAGHPYHGGH